jgi:restriction system protein
MARRKSFLERMLSGETQQARDQREREIRNVEAHVRRHAQRKADLDRVRAEREQAKADQEQLNARLTADLRDQSASLHFHLRRLTEVLHDREHGSAASSEALAAAFSSGGAEQFASAVQDELSASPYPPCLPARTTVLGYWSDARELIIERELPRNSVIPPEQDYRVVQGTIHPVPRRSDEVRHLYAQLLARIALRTTAEAFALTPPTLVDRVVVNGQVSTVDRATGSVTHPTLLSAGFDREPFEELHLDAPELDPELCLRSQSAIVSPHPYDLVPVRSLLSSDLDSRLDLLALHADEFESLVRRLFQARGLKAWQTQMSRDDGVDAVAMNEDPLHGGVAVIQAKRYNRVVPTEAVRALARAMTEKRAARGILVTTSWVCRETLDFARRNGRIQVIEGRELKQLLAESLHLNVLVSLPTLPQGGDRAQVA